MGKSSNKRKSNSTANKYQMLHQAAEMAAAVYARTGELSKEDLAYIK